MQSLESGCRSNPRQSTSNVVNYLSTLPSDLHTGGFTAMNVAALEAVRGIHPVRYVGPIDPPLEAWRKILSKIGRMMGVGGDFFQYSETRLARIAAEVAQRSDPGASMDFFHGFTPWVLTTAERPFVAWSDCTFREYMNVFHDRGLFNASDLARIEDMEARWLKRAEAVVFTSRWAAGLAKDSYGLDAKRIHVVCAPGNLTPPERDIYSPNAQFAFVSTNFITKGGLVVLKAFQELRKEHPEARLVVAGDRGPLNPSEPGVEYIGFLRKEVPEEKERLIGVFSRSRSIVNASLSDTAPVLLVEAAYHGCPAISSKRYAIPEIVEDGLTGILIEDPRDHLELKSAMARMLADEATYLSMRKAAWAKSRGSHSKEAFESQLQSVIRGVLG